MLSLGRNNPKQKYYMCDVEMESVHSFRDLGVMVNEDLKSSLHCRTIAAKALRISGLIFRAFCTKNVDVLLKAFVTYVRPLLEYCTVVWSPHLAKDIHCVERVQRHFTKRLYFRCHLGQTSYENRCKALGLGSLEVRRIRQDLMMCFKILKGFVRINPNDFFHFNLNERTRTRGHSKKLYVEHSRIDSRKYFFSNRVISIWNSLNDSHVKCESIGKFKSLLEKLDLKMFCKIYKF